MKKGETAALTVTAQAQEAQSGLLDVVTTVVLTLEPQEFDAPKFTWSLSEQEKVDFVVAWKDVTGALYRSGRRQIGTETEQKDCGTLQLHRQL